MGHGSKERIDSFFFLPLRQALRSPRKGLERGRKATMVI